MARPKIRSMHHELMFDQIQNGVYLKVDHRLLDDKADVDLAQRLSMHLDCISKSAGDLK